jgi:hypothetical protein
LLDTIHFAQAEFGIEQALFDVTRILYSVSAFLALFWTCLMRLKTFRSSAA